MKRKGWVSTLPPYSLQRNGWHSLGWNPTSDRPPNGIKGWEAKQDHERIQDTLTHNKNDTTPGPGPTNEPKFPYPIYIYINARIRELCGVRKGQVACSRVIVAVRECIWNAASVSLVLPGFSASGGLSPLLNGSTLGDCLPFTFGE